MTKVSCWAIHDPEATGRRPGWEVCAPSPAEPGNLEITHFFGPRARQRAEAYAATLAPLAPPPPPPAPAPRVLAPPPPPPPPPGP